MNALIILSTIVAASAYQNDLSVQQNDQNYTVWCSQDQRRCKSNQTVYVSRNFDNNCEFHECPGAQRYDSTEKEAFKTKINQQGGDIGTVLDYKDMFLGNSNYTALSQQKKKELKLGIFKEYRGKKFSFNKNDTDQLPFASGGVKIFNATFISDKKEFKMIDKAEFVDDIIECNDTNTIMFEGTADFTFNGVHYEATTVRGDGIAYYHNTSFKKVADGQECATNEDGGSCKVGDVIFEINFAGSAGVTLSSGGTNTASTDSDIPEDDGGTSTSVIIIIIVVCVLIFVGLGFAYRYYKKSGAGDRLDDEYGTGFEMTTTAV